MRTADSTFTSRPPSSAAIEAAITWSVRLNYNRSDADTVRCFEAWLEADAQHAEAWTRIQTLRQTAASRTVGLRAENVLNVLKPSASPSATRRKLLGVAALGVLVPVWALRPNLTESHNMVSSAQLRTEHHAGHWVSLTDGSQLRLNLHTQLSCTLFSDRHLLNLHQGEVMIEHASTADAADLHIECGTLCIDSEHAHVMVRHDERHTAIHVREGAVRIANNQTSLATTRWIGAGQSWFSDTAQMRETHQQALDPFAWLEGLLTARSLPLQAFAQELTRYRRGPIWVARAVRQLPVSGVFRLDDPNGALTLLTQLLPVRVQGNAHWPHLPVRLTQHS